MVNNEAVQRETGGGLHEEQSEDSFLLFYLGNELYGTPLLGVREIVEMYPVKPVANAKDYFMGVMNLRGQIVGMIDLRRRFGVASKVTKRNALLVFDAEAGPLAALVDRVDSVMSIGNESISRQSNIVTSIPQDYFLGIARVNSTLVTLIDLQRVLGEDEFIQVRKNGTNS